MLIFAFVTHVKKSARVYYRYGIITRFQVEIVACDVVRIFRRLLFLPFRVNVYIYDAFLIEECMYNRWII